MNSPVVAALSLLHFQSGDGVALIAEPAGKNTVRILERFPDRKALGQTLHMPFDIAPNGLAVHATGTGRISLEWTILCGARPNHLAAMRIPDHSCYLVVGSISQLPSAELLSAAAHVIGPLLSAGESTQVERNTTESVNAVIRHLPVPVLFVNSRNPSVYMNDLARALLGIADPRAGETAVAPALSRLFESPEARSHLSALLRDPRAHLVFECSHESGDLQVETRWISDQAISGRLWVFSDISRAKARERKLRLMANHDALTGVANRRAFELMLPGALDKASSSEAPISVLMIDLDHFKTINDTYGHQAGDRVLQDVAGTMMRVVRSSDTLARLGGEEFAVALPNTGPRAAAEAAERIRAAVAEKEILHGELRLRVTCSIGAATFRTGDDYDALVARADEALYAAKRQGRNRVSCAVAA